MGLLVVFALALDCIDELDVVTESEALHLDSGLAGCSGGTRTVRNGALYDLCRLVLEDIDELLVVVERDCALCAVIVLHEHRTLGADDVATRIRNLATVCSSPLGHDRSFRLDVAVIPVERNCGQFDAGTHLRLACLVGELHFGLERICNVVVGFRHHALGIGNSAKLKTAESEVHRVASHIAEGTRAEVVETAPRERVVHILAELPRIVHVGICRIHIEERTLLSGSEPSIPVETLTDGIALRMALHP